MFGDKVYPEHIIGETLRRSTLDLDFTDPVNLGTLQARINGPQSLPLSYVDFVADPLAAWIETHLGLRRDTDTGKLVRAIPCGLLGKDGAAHLLNQQTGLPEDICYQALIVTLMAGYKVCHPETNFPVFAFRLHQFISRGDTVYASLENEAERYCTVNGQKFVPGDRRRVLLALIFCRECGQEYYVARKFKDKETGLYQFSTRELDDHLSNEDGEAGYLYLNTINPWLPEKVIEKVPEDWLEEKKGELQVKSGQRKYLPETHRLNTQGYVDENGLAAQFIPGKFRFCLHCGVSYNPRQGSEFAKLTQLSSGGRSTDTTVLSLSLVRNLRADTTLIEKARKLLSFTDNRQDASLQSGHFNDFVEMALLRSGVYRAVKQAGSAGIAHEVLPQQVFDALKLDFRLYALSALPSESGQRRLFRQCLSFGARWVWPVLEAQ